MRFRLRARWVAAGVVRRLGPSGRLYATEIDSGLLETIRKAARTAGLGNITAVQAGEHTTGLPEACCDLIYMHRVYHHLTDPASINKSIMAALRPGGRLVVIDMPIQPWMPARRHGIAREDLVAQLTKAGFVVERQLDGWSMLDYCVVFRKPPPGSPAATCQGVPAGTMRSAPALMSAASVGPWKNVKPGRARHESGPPSFFPALRTASWILVTSAS
jgi:SAM-dependent methyltransferase